MYHLPKGYLPVVLGSEIHILMGGPYRSKPVHFKGVKMAEEIHEPCSIDIPTRDFATPDEKVFLRGVVEGFVRMFRGQHLYVGCMGGIGRTGLYMAAMAKCMYDAGWIDDDPVAYVRRHYLPHAVETEQQQEFIAGLPTLTIAQWLQSVAN